MSVRGSSATMPPMRQAVESSEAVLPSMALRYDASVRATL